LAVAMSQFTEIMADVMFLKLLLIGIVVCSVFVKTRVIEVQDVEAVRFF
jgi:hypothetical protein